VPTLADPLLVCREILLGTDALTALVGDRVYATPDLPPDRAYPCIRLTHIGAADHSPVPFRHAATAGVQMDVWAEDMPTTATVAETALDALHGVPRVPGALHIRPISEAREIDEAVQPPLYRYRADLSVRVTAA
jgi:hypothetical protein